jgi:hypothetical protein
MRGGFSRYIGLGPGEPDDVLSPGPPREIMQGGTRLLWGPGDRLRPLSKFRI